MKGIIKKLILMIPSINRLYLELLVLRRFREEVDNTNVQENKEAEIMALAAQSPAKLKLMKNFEELDEFIKECKSKSSAGLSLSEQRDYWKTHQLDFESFVESFTPRPNCDPFSEEYKNWEMSFFEFISGRDYKLSNEGSDVTNMKGISSLDVYGFDYRIWQIKVYADFMDKIRPKPGLRVLDMGGGFGYLAEFMARLGCNVTTIDLAKGFEEYIRETVVAGQNIELKAIQGSFYDIENYEETYDIIVFEQSLHHCCEPVRMFEILSKKVVPGGRVYLLNEPFTQQYDRPWGIVRYDGETMMQIRMNGWMELGYRMDFFEELVFRTGFKLVNMHMLHGGGCNLFEIMKM